MIKAIIFDCFGVFYADPVFEYMRRPTTSASTAKALHELDIQAAEGNLDKPGFIRKSAVLLNITKVAAEEQFFLPRSHNQELVDFVVKARSKYKTALLSNIGGDMMDGFFSSDDYIKLFDVVVLSGDVGMTKPDPAIFRLTCSKLGVPLKDTVMVDDMPETIQVVKQLGMQGIRYKDFPQFLQEWLTVVS
jgi:HAD superfamily hydrolase (TIGR01549 family)